MRDLMYRSSQVPHITACPLRRKVELVRNGERHGGAAGLSSAQACSREDRGQWDPLRV